MTEVAASTAQAEFAALLRRVEHDGERILLHRDGTPVAALIPAEDLALLERLVEEEEDRIDIAEAERILADPTEERIPLAQVLAEEGITLGMDLDEDEV